MIIVIVIVLIMILLKLGYDNMNNKVKEVVINESALKVGSIVPIWGVPNVTKSNWLECNG